MIAIVQLIFLSFTRCATTWWEDVERVLWLLLGPSRHHPVIACANGRSLAGASRVSSGSRPSHRPGASRPRRRPPFRSESIALCPDGGRLGLGLAAFGCSFWSIGTRRPFPALDEIASLAMSGVHRASSCAAGLGGAAYVALLVASAGRNGARSQGGRRLSVVRRAAWRRCSGAPSWSSSDGQGAVACWLASWPDWPETSSGVCST